MASNTLVQVEFTEACHWIASFLNQTLHNDTKKHILPVIERNTEKRQLHDATRSIQPIPVKRLRTDIALFRQMIEKKGNPENNWIDTTSKIPHSLKKLWRF